jgi:hypothetical protein
MKSFFAAPGTWSLVLPSLAGLPGKLCITIAGMSFATSNA